MPDSSDTRPNLQLQQASSSKKQAAKAKSSGRAVQSSLQRLRRAASASASAAPVGWVSPSKSTTPLRNGGLHFLEIAYAAWWQQWARAYRCSQSLPSYDRGARLRISSRYLLTPQKCHMGSACLRCWMLHSTVVLCTWLFPLLANAYIVHNLGSTVPGTVRGTVYLLCSVHSTHKTGKHAPRISPEAHQSRDRPPLASRKRKKKKEKKDPRSLIPLLQADWILALKKAKKQTTAGISRRLAASTTSTPPPISAHVLCCMAACMVEEQRERQRKQKREDEAKPTAWTAPAAVNPRTPFCCRLSTNHLTLFSPWTRR